MFPLGHVGIGTRMIPARIRDGLRWPWLALGCLLPDVLDKPVFLAARLARPAGPLHLDALRGSRLLGHSLLLFALLMAAAAAFPRAERLRAVAWGVATHLLLDLVPDLISGSRLQWPTWLLWPIFGWGFPFDAPRALVPGLDFEGLVYRVGELVGATLLALDYILHRRSRAWRRR